MRRYGTVCLNYVMLSTFDKCIRSFLVVELKEKIDEWKRNKQNKSEDKWESEVAKSMRWSFILHQFFYNFRIGLVMIENHCIVVTYIKKNVTREINDLGIKKERNQIKGWQYGEFQSRMNTLSRSIRRSFFDWPFWPFSDRKAKPIPAVRVK